MTSVVNITIIVILTLLSGYGDSQGFYHASTIWNGNRLALASLIKSAIGFIIGISSYWIVIKYLNQFNIVSPELQTIGWFGVTIIGLAITSGKIIHWHFIDQLIAILVLFGIGILLFRNGG